MFQDLQLIEADLQQFGQVLKAQQFGSTTSSLRVAVFESLRRFSSSFLEHLLGFASGEYLSEAARESFFAQCNLLAVEYPGYGLCSQAKGCQEVLRRNQALSFTVSIFLKKNASRRYCKLRVLKKFTKPWLQFSNRQ